MNIDERHVCARCLSPITEGARCELCGFLESEYAPEPHHLPPETLLQRRYLVASVLGEGGFGVTYAAWDLTLDRPVAIKEYFPRFTAERDTSKTYAVSPLSGGLNKNWFAAGRDRFLREARILATLSGIRGVVPALDCFEENGTAYIVMDFIRGVSLRRLADQFGGKLPASELLPMLRPVLDALILVHRSGLLHRDISPDNILIDRDGSAWLIDFGAAEEAQRGLDDVSRTILLRKGYTPLEQYDSHGEQGVWTDVYALSATIYDLLCGQAPPEAVLRTGRDPLVKPNKLGARLSPRQQRALLRGLVVHVSPRISSMELLRSRLYNLPLPEEVRWRKRLIRNIALAGAVIVLVGGLFALNATTGLPTFSGTSFSITSNGVFLQRYNGDSKSITVPNTFLGFDVSGISNHAFVNAQNIQFIQLPDTIRTIDEMAFSGCSDLVSIRIPDGTTQIGEYAFLGCSALERVTLPASITSIADNAFEGCSSDIILYCDKGSYAQIFAVQKDMDLTIESDYAYTIKGGEAMIIAYTGTDTEIIIPSEIDGCPITMIGPRVFANKSITNVKISNGITEIGESAFEECKFLESIDLPASLRNIGKKAFYVCKRLKQITIPEGVTEIGESAFGYNSSLTFISLPDSLCEIGEALFYFCTSLEKVSLPDHIIDLPDLTFFLCDQLVEVKLPANLKMIHDRAFGGCYSLTDLQLPESLRTIEDSAFSGCSSLTTIYIPKELKGLTLGAFGSSDFTQNGCPELTIIGYPGTKAEQIANAWGVRFDNILIWEDASNFTYEVNEDSIVITGYLGHSTNLVIPDYINNLPVVEIGIDAFQYNTELLSVILPKRLVKVDDFAFYSCSSLQSVIFPSSLAAIGQFAFSGCDLTMIDLPNNVSALGRSAFENNENVEYLRLGDNIHDENFAFPYLGKLKKAIVQSVYSITLGLFLECRDLETVRFENGVYRIEKDAFVQCYLLKDVYIPESVIYIDKDAFSPIPDSLTIHGKPGSVAETYAIANGIRFIAEY